MARKIKLAVWKFASCDGCQLSLLDCEDELLAVAGAVDIAYFPEATSTMKRGPYDVSLVEGSITTPHDAERIKQVRASSKRLVTIGACATSGGVQALRNFRDHPEMMRVVYARPDYIDTLATSTPIADHVPVDFELRGCPINKRQLLDVLTALVHGRTPRVPRHAVCLECKIRGHVCVMVAHGTPCLGPVTHAGCGALCPGFSRGCYGCYGPNDAPQTAPLARRFLMQGVPADDVGRMFLTFNANAPAFRAEGLAMSGRESTRERAMKTRTIKVDYMPRVEGEAALTVKIRGDDVISAELRIFEPPRLFEAMLRGRSCTEAPDLTARICGICPVAYQMSACAAVEDALGVAITDEVRALRRLLYCGEWVESHVLHMVMLHAPDFLDVPDFAAIAKLHPERVKAALRMKKAGNAVMATLGGREIHPVNVRVGGFYRAPRRDELTPLLPELRWAQGAALEMLDWVSGFSFPTAARDYLFVALRHPREYPMNEGHIVSSAGLDIGAREYDSWFTEAHEQRSHALHTTHRGRTMLCGPLARLALCSDRLPAGLRDTAERLGLGPARSNPWKSILARGIEVALAFDEAVRLIEGYSPPAEPFTPAKMRAGTGHGCTEAPRGILYHRYSLREDGIIEDAKIVPPTSQNQRVMEEDLFRMGKELASLPKDAARKLAEQSIRNYDPCISCATHFLDLRVERVS